VYHRGMITEEKKRQARYKAVLARSKGELKRQPCEVCGTTKKVEAHHLDYENPLDVNWLCFEHHRDWHQKNNKKEMKGTKEKTYYKAIFVPQKLHNDIKMEALKSKQTMINFLESLISPNNK